MSVFTNLEMMKIERQIDRYEFEISRLDSSVDRDNDRIIDIENKVQDLISKIEISGKLAKINEQGLSIIN